MHKGFRRGEALSPYMSSTTPKNHLAEALINDLDEYLHSTNFILQKIKRLESQEEAELYIRMLHERKNIIRRQQKVNELTRVKEHFQIGEQLTADEIANLQVGDCFWRIAGTTLTGVPRDRGEFRLLEIYRISGLVSRNAEDIVGGETFFCRSLEIDNSLDTKIWLYLPSAGIRECLIFSHGHIYQKIPDTFAYDDDSERYSYHENTLWRGKRGCPFEKI